MLFVNLLCEKAPFFAEGNASLAGWPVLHSLLSFWDEGMVVWDDAQALSSTGTCKRADGNMHPADVCRHKTGSWDSRRIQSYYQPKDILVAMVSSSAR